MATPPNTPTPDFGTLGPGSDIKLSPDLNNSASKPSEFWNLKRPGNRTGAQVPAAARIAALAFGGLAAFGIFVATSAVKKTHRADDEVSSTAKVSRRSTQAYSSAAQKDAEQLLERATRNEGAATSQIETRAASWRGQLRLTPKLTNLITAGLNSNDRQVRAATVQLDLAAMNVTEDSSTVDQLAAQAESKDHATRIWALWTLGLLANRGIATDHITDLLIAHLSDSDVDARHWAAEGLAYTGRDAAIQPLLKTMHDDSSLLVREAAARGLAQSGMFTSEQRRSTIPTLLVYANEVTLDGTTRAWTFHALRDITEQNLPDDAAKWNEWYAKSR